MVRFSITSGNASSSAFSSSKVIAPLLSLSADSNSANVRSSSFSSGREMALSRRQDFRTILSSSGSIEPLPVRRAGVKAVSKNSPNHPQGFTSMCVCVCVLTVHIVDLKQEAQFVGLAAVDEEVQGLQQFVQTDGAAAVGVKEGKETLGKEGLETETTGQRSEVKASLMLQCSDSPL